MTGGADQEPDPREASTDVTGAPEPPPRRRSWYLLPYCIWTAIGVIRFQGFTVLVATIFVGLLLALIYVIWRSRHS